MITNKLILLVCIAGALTACNRTTDEAQKAVEPSKIIREKLQQPANVPRPDAPTTKELLNYYSANLAEAKEVWRACREKGIQNLTAEEKPRCVAAQNAWYSQPYKPK